MALDPVISNFIAGMDGIFLDAVPGAVAAALGAVRAPLSEPPPASTSWSTPSTS